MAAKNVGRRTTPARQGKNRTGKILKNTCVSFGCYWLLRTMERLSHEIPGAPQCLELFFKSFASHFLLARLERYERKFVVFRLGLHTRNSSCNKNAGNNSLALPLQRKRLRGRIRKQEALRLIRVTAATEDKTVRDEIPRQY